MQVYKALLETTRKHNNILAEGGTNRAFRFPPSIIKWAMLMRLKAGELCAGWGAQYSGGFSTRVGQASVIGSLAK